MSDMEEEKTSPPPKRRRIEELEEEKDNEENKNETEDTDETSKVEEEEGEVEAKEEEESPKAEEESHVQQEGDDEKDKEKEETEETTPSDKIADDKEDNNTAPTEETPKETREQETSEAAEEITQEEDETETANNDDSSATIPEPEKNPYDSLRWSIINNDGQPESLIKLVALKSLFAKQLPKMPRTYIARLVFDRRHTSLAILSDDPALKDTDEEVIGAICFRAFDEMRFAEIAFCAVNASHQVKGYGTKLMNLLKKEGAIRGIEYFITYADNYAIGYFKKQGFTKSIQMPKGRYTGLIKDYDGGTMMECYVHPSIDFTRIPQMIAAQRAFILKRIRLKANSHKAYDPLPKNFNPSLEGVSRANHAAARAMAIPGMSEAGWTMQDLLASTGQGKDLDRAKNALKSELLSMVRKIEEQQFAWPFREPVDISEVPDYVDVVKEPIDLLTIDKRIRKGDHYKSKQMLYSDLVLMVNNCKLYNETASTYVQCAMNLEKFLISLFSDMKSRG